jgi:ribosomal protein S27AE
VGHPKRPSIIDAKITAEYVVCGVCLTKNRVVSHRKVLRPVCGRCGYPLPDPFGAQVGIRPFGEWIARYRRALAIIAGVLLLGLIVWLASGREEYPSSLSGLRTQPPDTALINHHGAPVYAVAVVIGRETSADGDDEQVGLPPGTLPSWPELQSASLYGIGTSSPTTPESLVILIDVCGGRAQEYFQAGSGHEGELPGVFVFSYLQQMKDDSLNPLVGPHVVEQIYLNTGLDPRG